MIQRGPSARDSSYKNTVLQRAKANVSHTAFHHNSLYDGSSTRSAGANMYRTVLSFL